MNQEVKSPKTMAALMINLYNAVQKKEGIDYSKNQKFKRALSFLNDLKDDAESVGDEELEDVSEVGGYDRKGNKVNNSDRDTFKKRPQAGMAALLKKDDIDESFKSLAKKVDKQKGVDKDYAGKIAGKIANIKRKGVWSHGYKLLNKRNQPSEDEKT